MGDSEGGAGSGAGLADAVLLAPLTEDTFLHNLHVRYKRDIIYTYVGNALVSVNPSRALPLYSAELVRAYLARPPYQLPPHLYAITASAYRWVRDRHSSQVVVVTGESGAGKTEAARVCLQCVVLAGDAGDGGHAAGTGAGAGAGARLTAAGTLLEAFGNAATARNHNASRFGKLLDVEFDFKGAPVGGHITHYLLEKERVRGPADGERNFHVLYQLLAGADAHLLRFGGAVCGGVLRVLAFILKLGNVEFEPHHNIDGTIGARLQHHYELTEACSVVGVCSTALTSALVGAGAGEGRGEEEEELPAADWAAALRDRILHAVYARLFTWLVNEVNVVIAGGSGGRGCTLGILDVYGFESLAHNGLERLLINYAAERLQAAVTAATLCLEQEDYKQEGLQWTTLQYCDHELGAELLDLGPDSVLGALRDATLRAAGDVGLLQRLQRRRHPRLTLLPPDHFQVVHFAGAVTYNARGMVSHNRDAVCRRACAALGGAREPLLAALFARAPGSPRARASLACRQRALLAALLRRLPAAPRLVRCLRPDRLLRPHRFDAPLVRHQIRTQGIMDMALLRRAGWCESMPARAVLSRYGMLRGAGAGHAGHSGEGQGQAEGEVRVARALLRALPIPSAEFAYGRTKVFIRSPRTVWELEALRAARVSELVSVVQRAWRRHRARQRAARRRRAQSVIARAWRAYLATREVPERAALRRVRALGGAGARCWAAGVLWRAWAGAARRRYLLALGRRLPARHRSPALAAWPPCPLPALLARTDELLRRLHHRWRCRLYRAEFDQTARNRMREKVTASALFKDRKLTYPRSVAHPFVGDYVRLRASAAWRRGLVAGLADRYVVFADVVGKVVRSSGRVARCLCVVSTGALLLLEPRSLRLKRRVPAHAVYRLSLSPLADDVLVVHVRAPAPAADEPGCLLGGERRRGDLVLRTCHVLELATKLFLVVQNAVGAPPQVNIAPEFDADFGQQTVTVAFHALSEGGAPARLLRRGSRLDVLL
ncbi:unconventional myosin-Ib isoform X2 [Plodia interpunctella]|uniref:unconventional myosin-Ib isoform X2 n=1 Tax=Plodia interpunctella TaxID=58824 RepID=UPI0023680024|nr:unconventional myosin-Ib isoform X2 [Plodia interpunctella]